MQPLITFRRVSIIAVIASYAEASAYQLRLIATEPPGELAEFSQRHDTLPSGSLSPPSATPEIASVYLNAREYADAKWRLNGVYTVEWMSSAGLESIIREKEAKSAEYETCDAYWLLVVVDGMDAAQEQEIRVDGLKIPSTVFERIVVFKPGFNHIVQIWP